MMNMEAIKAKAIISLIVAAFACHGLQSAGLNPGLGIILGFVVFLARMKPPQRDFTTHGTARFASKNEVREAGLLTANGIVLGRDSWGRLLKTPEWTAHLLCIAATGAGKGVSIIVPTLLSYSGSIIVGDFKNGENAILTAMHRRRFGKVVCIDPFGVIPDLSMMVGKFNPLDVLSVNSTALIDNARSLATAIVKRSEHEQQPYFNDVATQIIELFIVFVLLRGEPAERNLNMVCALVSNEDAYFGSLSKMKEMDDCDGIVAQKAYGLSHLKRGERETNACLSTVLTHIAPFQSPLIRTSWESTTIDLHQLRKSGTTLYICMDATKLESHSGYTRLLLSALLVFLMQNRGEKVRFILDEVAHIGHIPLLETAITTVRGFGINLAMFVQGLPQLAKLFPSDQGKTALGNFDVKVFFGINDRDSASEVSECLGDATIWTQSTNAGGGFSSSDGTSGGQSNRSINYSDSSGTTYNPHARRLMKLEELLQLRDEAIITIRGRRPVLARLIRYFDDPSFRKSGQTPRSKTLPRLLAWLTLIGITIIVVMAFLRNVQS